jgi:hypothetical protein
MLIEHDGARPRVHPSVPARMFPPKSHDEIWAIQRELDFVGTVARIDRSALAGQSAMSALTATYAALYGRHRDDEVLAG